MFGRGDDHRGSLFPLEGLRFLDAVRYFATRFCKKKKNASVARFDRPIRFSVDSELTGGPWPCRVRTNIPRVAATRVA